MVRFESDEMDSEDPAVCSKDLKKYFFVIAAAAAMIVFGAFWYMEFFSKGSGMRGMTRGGPPVQMAGGRGPALANALPGVLPGPPGVVATPVGKRVVRGDFASVAMAMRKSVVNVHVNKAGGVAMQKAPADAAANAGDAVRFAAPLAGRSIENVGSGVVVRNDGYILTNYHVVRGSSAVFVTVFDDFGTERYRAEVVKLDESVDLALLKIRPKTPLSPAMLGNSDGVRVADEVIAIGSPFGLDQTVSRGIVSAKRKSLVIEGVSHKDLLQTDAAINQGNSGGPLVDGSGAVIGINTAIYTPTGAFSGVGFAVPSNHAQIFISDEIGLPNARRTASFGRRVVMARKVNPGTAVGVTGPTIVAGTPSPHKDGREQLQCNTCHQLVASSSRPTGTTVAFRYQYATPPSTLAMNVIAPGPQGQGMGQGMGQGRGGGLGPRGQGGVAVMGAFAQPITPVLAVHLDQPVGKGVFINNVVLGSPMAKAGLRPGDIVLKVDGRRMRTPHQFALQLSGYSNGDAARIGILRGGGKSDLDLIVAALPAAQAGGGTAAPAPAATPVPTEFSWLGMEVENFSAVNPAGVPADANIKGAVVAEITAGSQAETAGIQTNDVIIGINNRPVGSPASLDKAIRDADGKKGNLLRMIRNDRQFFAVLP